MVARLTRIVPLLLLLAFVAGVVYVVAAWRYSPARAKEILIKAFTVLNVALAAFFGLASLYALSESNGDVLGLTLSFMVTALVALGITRICRAVFLKHNPSYRMKPMKAKRLRRLALGKKIDREGVRNRAPFYGAGRRWENGLRKSGRASFKEHAVEVVAYGERCPL